MADSLAAQTHHEVKHPFKAALLQSLAVLLFSLGQAIAPPAMAAQRTFNLHGVNLALEDLTSDVDVYYTSMRRKRSAGEWNIEVTVSNKTTRAISGPLLLVVQSFSGTSGPRRSDGVSENQFFFDLTGQLPGGALRPGEKSAPRTLGLGFTLLGAPRLQTRVYAAAATVTKGAGFTRSLNAVGQPLPAVIVTETGPTSAATRETDGSFGVATLGQGPGDHFWKFSATGYLSVWRRSVLGTNSVTVIPYPRLTPRNPQMFAITPLSGGVVSNQTVTVQFPPGAVPQSTGARLTGLDGQTLPFFCRRAGVRF